MKFRQTLHTFQTRLARFALDSRGNVAMITGLLAIPLVGAVGAGIDYTRLVSYRLKLDSAATSASLAAIDTARALLLTNPTISAAELDATAKARADQVFAGLAPPDSIGTTAFLRIGDTLSAKVDFTGELATTFLGVFSIQKLNSSGASNSAGQIEKAPGSDDPNVLMKENFDVSGLTAVRSLGPSSVYKDFNNWKTNNLGIEIGKGAVFGDPPPGGGNVVELDVIENSFMARRVFLTPGKYELRYWYKDRIQDANYAPAFVCGASQADISWATTVTRSPRDQQLYTQSNLIAAYLEPANSDSPPDSFSPSLHTEIDACLLSSGKWIERTVKITTYATGFFWLAFQAEGASDGYGGLLSGIQFCKTACPGAPTPTPFPWAADKVLFSDDFDRETNYSDKAWTERTLDDSGVNSGWTNLPTGWTTWPENQIDFQKWGTNGTTAVELDGSSGAGKSHRGISRRFILTPGYYALNYVYTSQRFLSPAYNLCGRTTMEANLATAKATNTTSFAFNTAIIGAFIDPDLLFSHPYSDPVLRAPASWFNPDDTPATLPRLPSNMVDACVSSNGRIQRTVNFRINKTGFYWLTMKADGKDDNHGGAVDDFLLKALGGLSMSPPADAVTIPFGGIAPGSIVKKRQLEFIAN